jgi:hypothetical protein
MPSPELSPPVDPLDYADHLKAQNEALREQARIDHELELLDGWFKAPEGVEKGSFEHDDWVDAVKSYLKNDAMSGGVRTIGHAPETKTYGGYGVELDKADMNDLVNELVRAEGNGKDQTRINDTWSAVRNRLEQSGLSEADQSVLLDSLDAKVASVVGSNDRVAQATPKKDRSKRAVSTNTSEDSAETEKPDTAPTPTVHATEAETTPIHDEAPKSPQPPKGHRRASTDGPVTVGGDSSKAQDPSTPPTAPKPPQGRRHRRASTDGPVTVGGSSKEPPTAPATEDDTTGNDTPSAAEQKNTRIPHLDDVINYKLDSEGIPEALRKEVLKTKPTAWWNGLPEDERLKRAPEPPEQNPSTRSKPTLRDLFDRRWNEIQNNRAVSKQIKERENGKHKAEKDEKDDSRETRRARALAAVAGAWATSRTVVTEGFKRDQDSDEKQKDDSNNHSVKSKIKGTVTSVPFWRSNKDINHDTKKPDETDKPTRRKSLIGAAAAAAALAAVVGLNAVSNDKPEQSGGISASDARDGDKNNKGAAPSLEIGGDPAALNALNAKPESEPVQEPVPADPNERFFTNASRTIVLKPGSTLGSEVKEYLGAHGKVVNDDTVARVTEVTMSMNGGLTAAGATRLPAGTQFRIPLEALAEIPNA